MYFSPFNRPEYGSLAGVGKHFPTIPLMALTATATPVITQTLLQMLREPLTLLGSVNKPNLSFEASELCQMPSRGWSVFFVSALRDKGEGY